MVLWFYLVCAASSSMTILFFTVGLSWKDLMTFAKRMTHVATVPGMNRLTTSFLQHLRGQRREKDASSCQWAATIIDLWRTPRMYLFAHYTAADVIDLDDLTGNWAPILDDDDEPLMVGQMSMLQRADFSVRGSCQP